MKACPKDRAELLLEKCHGFHVSHCGTCAGLWLPPELVVTAMGPLPRIVPTLDSTNGKLWQCPRDKSVLHPVRHRGVEIDVCPACGGVWLDYGELETILRCKKIDAKTSDSSKRDGASLVVEAGGEVITNLDALSAATEFTGDAAGAVLSFVAEALSGF